MNEQIILTQDDFGIEIQMQFITSKKVPIDITNCSIEIVFVKPDDTATREYAYITDNLLGKCGFVLKATHTDLEGLYKTYWSVTDVDDFITAQEALYYYVVAKHGGNTTEV